MKRILRTGLILFLLGCTSNANKYLGEYEKSDVLYRMKNENTFEILISDIIEGKMGFTVYVDIPIVLGETLSFPGTESTRINDLIVFPYYAMTGIGQEEHFVVKNEGSRVARVADNLLIIYLTYKVKPVMEEEYMLLVKEFSFKYDAELNCFSLIIEE